tara:strand:- start:996 stop:1700 length:705 start_codon:yes stop_codon:yes gene_type:complete
MKKILILLTVSTFLYSCSQDKNNSILTSTEAAPNHYELEFENEYLRIIRVKYSPGETSAMHSHEPTVGVTLTGGQGIFTDLEGNSVSRPENFPGDVLVDDGTPHSVTSISKSDEELIFIEVKKKYKSNLRILSKDIGVPNAVELDPETHIVEIEQPNIRVVRIKSPAGSQTPMHSHNAGVTVALTDMRVEHTSLTGEVTEITRSAGDAGWREETAHSGKNLSDKPLEVILFEML